MKSILLSAALLIIGSLSFAQSTQIHNQKSKSYTSKDLRTYIAMNTPDFVKVYVAKVPGKNVRIRVKQNNVLLYQNSYKSYAIVDLDYDISQFPTGDYTFEILKDRKVVYQQNINHTQSSRTLAQR